MTFRAAQGHYQERRAYLELVEALTAGRVAVVVGARAGVDDARPHADLEPTAIRHRAVAPSREIMAGQIAVPPGTVADRCAKVVAVASSRSSAW